MATQIMGILNVTPDSFHDGGKHNSLDAAIAHGIALYQEGADWIDIGGESTRPYAKPVSEKEELARILPVIKALRKEIPIPLSIDTRKAAVAEAALQEGVSLLNDVSGFSDPAMIRLAAASQLPICVMHMQGNPETMQNGPRYPEGIIPHLRRWFEEKVGDLINNGIKKEQIFLDPGIGFGKTVEDNFRIIHNLPNLRVAGCGVLLGVSRKSFMSKTLGKEKTETIAPTVAMNTIAVLAGVEIIRVHDVLAHREAVNVLNKFQEAGTG